MGTPHSGALHGSGGCPLPDVAEVIENDSGGRDCGRYVVIRASGAGIEETEAALVAHFESDGWVLAEDANGWDGTRSEGSHEYGMWMTVEFVDGYALEPTERVDAAREIHILIDPWASPDPTLPSGEAVTGPFLGSPRFVAGNVLVPTGDQVTAFDNATGEEIWHSEVCPSADWASPIEGPPADVAAFWCGDDLYGMDGSSGEVLWWHSPSGGFIDRTRTGPGVVLYTSEESGRVSAIDLSTGEELWSASTGDASIAANRDHAFVASDTDVTAYDLSSGEEVWVAPFPTSGLYADDRGVYARGSDQRMRRLDPATGEVVWETEVIDERLEWSEVIGVTEGAVVVQRTRAAHEVTVFDLENGDILWTAEGQADGDEGAQFWASAGGHSVIIADMQDHSIEVHDDSTGAVVADLGRPGAQWASVQRDQVAFVYLDGTTRQLGIESVG